MQLLVLILAQQKAVFVSTQCELPEHGLQLHQLAAACPVVQVRFEMPV